MVRRGVRGKRYKKQEVSDRGEVDFVLLNFVLKKIFKKHFSEKNW